MSSTANTTCFIEDGKSGFYAKGVGPLLCSSDTCGPYGRAEFGCEKCCAWPYSTPASLPAVKSSAVSLHPLAIASVAIGCISFGLILTYFIYFLLKKFVWKRGSCPDEESGLVQDDNVQTSPQRCDVEDDLSQDVNSTDARQVTMSGQNTVMQPSNDGELPLAQQPTDCDEHGGQQTQVVDVTSHEQFVIVMTSVSVTLHNSDPVYTEMVSNGSVPA